jgi:hypothetical protein
MVSGVTVPVARNSTGKSIFLAFTVVTDTGGPDGAPLAAAGAAGAFCAITEVLIRAATARQHAVTEKRGNLFMEGG